MKFKELHIKNIASVEAARISFDDGPLNESELFLICGETGAGKSTILDAICLALYNQTPRLEGLRRRGDKSPEVAPSADDRLTFSDPRNYMRRGAAESEITLLFTGNDGREYKADWSVGLMPRKKTIGKIKRCLSCEGENDVTQSKEINRLVADDAVVGLDYEQFCRTAMLAQGEFERFLSADDKDKASILEKLTGISRFTDLGAEINLMFKESRQRLDEVRARLSALETLDDAEVTALKDEAEKCHADIDNISAKIKAIKALSDYLLVRNGLSDNVKGLKEKLDTVTAVTQTDEYRTDADLIELYDRSTRGRALMQQRAGLSGNIEGYKNSLNSLKPGLLDESAKITLLQGHSYYLKQKLDENSNAKEKLAPYKSLIDNNAEAISLLNLIIDSLISCAQKQKSIEAETTRRQVLENNQVKTSKQSINLGAEIEANKTVLDELKKERNAIDTSKLAGEKSEIENFSHKIDNIRQLLQEIKVIIEAVEQYKRNIADAEAVNKELSEANSAGRIRLETLTETLKTLEQNYISATLDSSDAARSLRVRLHVGDKCPVCGNTVGELPVEAELKARSDAFAKSLDDTRKAIEVLNTAINKRERSISANKATITQLNDRVDTDTKSAEQKRNRVEELRVETKLSEITTESLGQMQQELERRRNAVREIELRCNGLDKKIAEQTTLIDTLNSKHKDLEINLTRLSEQIRANDEKIKSEKDEIASLSEKIERAADSLKTLGMHLDDYTSSENVKDSLDGLRKLVALRDSLDRESLRLENESADCRREYRLAIGLRDDIIAISPDTFVLPAMAEPAPQQHKVTLGNKLNDILTKATSLKALQDKYLADIRTIDAELDGIAAEDATLTREALAALMTDQKLAEYEQARLRHERDDKNVAEARAAYNAAIETLDKFMAENPRPEPVDPGLPEDSESLKEASQNLELEIDAKRQRLTIINETLKRDDETRRKIASEGINLDRMIARHKNLELLDSLYGGDKGFRFGKLAQSVILQQLLVSANHYLSLFSRRYQMSAESGSLQISIADSDFGGDKRPYNTLSGGERFMVSLALALGLSSVRKVTEAPDIIFIDEGFGTLSNDCLEQVTETLSALQLSEGRKVGIVSHVEGLKERIPVHICLTRVKNLYTEVKVTT